ncbi:SPOR domain-containing protein [Oricola cellulosilytica]|uniref:SPOR domain-containing protein n=1 Tax=Oricola cellulosilytica TaxID=1429082 RepID=A0A4R0P604_9HYPH|nr:SPOR domain-containing protein [Oricola cellulosilytica]TCD12345.1 hypothetical protein E0D97_15125 [Oricola cellulosilytica]
MTDATNRKLDVDDIDTGDIRRDDPLFELSQIIGFSEESDEQVADHEAGDAQIDLEDALLRELEGDGSDLDSGAEISAFAPAEPHEPDDGKAEARDVASEADAPVHSAETFSRDGLEVRNPDSAQSRADGSADVLEDELLALLGGIGEKTPVAQAWTSEPAEVEGETGNVSSDIPQSVSDPEGAAGEWRSLDEPEDPQPASYDASNWERDLVDGGHDDDVEADADDFAIFDEFETALMSDLELSFDESDEAAISEGDTAAAEIDPQHSEITEAASFGFDGTPDRRDDAPKLETSEMPIGGVEPMAPLDLPELPSVEKIRTEAEDIESELDAALAGFDNYDGGEAEHDEFRRAAFAAPAGAATAAQHLDIDMNAFEDDLARDFEYAQHDLAAGEKDENAGFSASQGEGERSRDEGRSRRGLVIAAIVGGVAILGTIGAFGLSGGGTGGQGEPVLVKADPDPVKVVPDDPGGAKVPNQDRAVYGEVDGNAPEAPMQETLVSTSEEPIDLSDGGSAILPSGLSEGVKVEDRLAPEADDGQTITARDNSGALAPRRVRTVVVKPDGTLVAKAPDSAAPSPSLGASPTLTQAGEASEFVKESDVPEAEAVETPPQDASAALSTAVSEVIEPEPAEPEIAGAVPDENTPTAPAGLAETPPTVTSDAASTDALIASGEEQPLGEQPALAQAPRRFNAPRVIPERPAEQPVTIVNQPATEVAVATRPEAAPPPLAQSAAASHASEYSVQIASLPSAALAQSTAANLKQRYSTVLGGRSINIQEAEIEGRGTFHRVRVAATSRSDAVALCERFKQAGGSCFVAR